jgi:hypothetical protein
LAVVAEGRDQNPGDRSRGLAVFLSSAPEHDGPRYDTDVLDELADRWSIDAGGASARIWFEVERPRWMDRESQPTEGDRADSTD